MEVDKLTYLPKRKKIEKADNFATREFDAIMKRVIKTNYLLSFVLEKTCFK